MEYTEFFIEEELASFWIKNEKIENQKVYYFSQFQRQKSLQILSQFERNFSFIIEDQNHMSVFWQEISSLLRWNSLQSKGVEKQTKLKICKTLSRVFWLKWKIECLFVFLWHQSHRSDKSFVILVYSCHSS